MEYRKVQEVGKGTLLISLPKDWVKKYGVCKGDVLGLEVDQFGNLILFSTKKKFTENLSVVDCRKRSLKAVLDDITGAYLLGYNLIKVVNLSFIENGDRKDVKTFLSKLAGLEIVEEDKDSMLVEFVTDISLLNPNKILNRMSLLVKTMFLDSFSSLLNHDNILAEDVIKVDDEVDRLYFLFVRLIRSAIQSPDIMRKFNLSAIECLDHRLYASLIESIGDYSSMIASNVINSVGITLDNGLSNVLHEIKLSFEKMFDIAYKAYMSKNITLKMSILTISDSIEEKINLIRTLTLNRSIKEISKISSIISAINFTRKALADITDLTTPSITV
ncbi:MAG: phosphate uptake regulator PhoU [Nitrososphaeria archaeon]|nr:phosphate uptake regulator PhoU [Nitrososphaeria archaeon]